MQMYFKKMYSLCAHSFISSCVSTHIPLRCVSLQHSDISLWAESRKHVLVVAFAARHDGRTGDRVPFVSSIQQVESEDGKRGSKNWSCEATRTAAVPLLTVSFFDSISILSLLAMSVISSSKTESCPLAANLLLETRRYM